MKLKLLLLLFTISFQVIAQNYKVIESNSKHLKIEFDFNNKYKIVDTLLEGKPVSYIKGKELIARSPGEPAVPNEIIHIGVPFGATPTIKFTSYGNITSQNKRIIPLLDSLEEDPSQIYFNKNIYSSNNYFPKSAAYFSSNFVYRYSKIYEISVAPFQYNPVSRELVFHSKIVVEVNYNQPISDNTISNFKIEDKTTRNYLNDVVINNKVAEDWIQKKEKYSPVKINDEPWYNSNKKYYKIFLKEKGVYRLTFEKLASSNIKS